MKKIILCMNLAIFWWCVTYPGFSTPATDLSANKHPCAQDQITIRCKIADTIKQLIEHTEIGRES